MKKISLLLALFVFIGINALYAQNVQVTGTVSSAEDGSVIPGATIKVKGGTTGVISDLDGKYSISVNPNATLIVSFVGLKTQEIAINGQNTINVTLQSDVIGLNEVVVTALGISRDKKSLGYATQQIKGDDVSTVKSGNIINSLSGKVSGVQIRTNNNFGGSSNIVIRGNKSLSGNNQALFVVDGVPLDNTSSNTTRQRGGSVGYDYGNPAADINPEDIETINILKGAASTALYGSRAANGVVLITTKSGGKPKGIGVTVSSGFSIGKIDKSTFPKYQNQYGAGYGQYYGPNEDDYFEKRDVNGDGVNENVVPTYDDASYGARLNPNLLVYQWKSFVPESDQYGKAYAYTAGKHTPVDFFENETGYNNSISIAGASDKSTYRLGYTYNQTNGILPNSSLNKHNISFKATHEFTKKLTSEVGVNYTLEDTKGRNSTGYNDNITTSFRQWWQVSTDVKDLEDLYKKTGKNYTWNQKAPWAGNITPAYWDNPYWTRYKNYETDSRDRITGYSALNYSVFDWLKASAKVSIDTYTELQEERRAIGSVATPFGLLGNDETSGYQRFDHNFKELNYDFLLNFNKNITQDVNIEGVTGLNIRYSKNNSIRASTNGGLVVPDLYALSNSVSSNPNPVEIFQRKQVNGVYARISAGYKNLLYIEGTDRYDYSSTLPENERGYNYWSLSGSFIFSELLKQDWLSSGKLRLNYAQVGNDAPIYSIADTYDVIDNFGSSTLFSVANRKNNSALKPEITKSYEAGIETKYFNNRVGLDVGVYKSNTYNQLIPSDITAATGFSSKWVNGGNVENRGIELSVNLKPIVYNNFVWDILVNWTKNKSKVIELYNNPATGEPLENIVIQSYQGGITFNAKKGEAYGIIKGTGYQYANGEKVVNSKGYYVAVADQIIGDPNPDWTSGITNSFSYKGLTFSFLIDIQHGGDVFSLDNYYGYATGLYENTVGNNELGNPIRDAVTNDSKSGGIILPGVQLAADGKTTTKNTVRASADAYNGVFYWGNSTRNPTQTHIYDASYIKLREASLTYNFPKQWLGTHIQNLALSVTGHNLWIIHKNVPYADPEAGLGAGNAQGYLSGAYPTVRQLGFNLKIDF